MLYKFYLPPSSYLFHLKIFLIERGKNENIYCDEFYFIIVMNGSPMSPMNRTGLQQGQQGQTNVEFRIDSSMSTNELLGSILQTLGEIKVTKK